MKELQAISMIQKILNKLSLTPRNAELGISLVLILKGLLLSWASGYFFYPPELATYLNNNYLDLLFTLIGISLLVSSHLKRRLSDEQAKYVALNIEKVSLVLAGVSFLALATFQITHGAFTVEYRMAHTALGDMFCFYITVLTARDI